MKELSIEEKAKRYDEASKEASVAYKDEDRHLKATLERIFPELKESEDEKIRKEIIDFLMGTNKYGTNEKCESWIAWLEKQGSVTKLNEEEQNQFAKSVLTSCALSFINYLDAHKYEGKMCVSNGECEDIENAFHNAMWDRLHRYYCKYIEKQGEQKPVIVLKFKVGDKVHLINGTSPNYEDDCLTIGEISNTTYYGDAKYGWFFIKDQDKYELVEQKPVEKPRWYDSMDELIADALIEEVGKSKLRQEEKDNRIYWINKHRQKPVEWGEEDETMITLLHNIIGHHYSLDIIKKEEQLKLEDWLKSLKDRVQPQPKQEWSMYDETKEYAKKDLGE